MTTKFADRVLRAVFIFVFVIGTVWVPDTNAIAQGPEPQNHPPIAEAGGPYGALKGQPVTLDASASDDPDGDALLYEWDFNNDGSYDDATGVTVTNVFEPGQYTVGLRVIDPLGLTGEDTATIMVDPLFSITPATDQLGGSQWPPDATVEVTVDDPATGIGQDFSITLRSDEGGNIGHYFADEIDLQPGFLVTVNGGGNLIKQHVIGNLTVTGADIGTDMISGTGDPGVRVDIVSWGNLLRHEIVDEHGNWTANFRGLGDEPDEQNTLDLRPNTGGYITQFDEDGDFTQIYWRIPNPSFQIRLTDDFLSAADWWANKPIDIRVDDPSTGLNPDYSTTQTTDGAGSLHYPLGEEIDLKRGFVVTIDDGINLTREMTIPGLAITAIDVNADIVHGVTEPGAVVNVWGCADECADRHETADQDGNWAANFATPGNEPAEQGTMNLRPDSHILVGQNDEDGDSVQILRYIFNPTFSVHPDDDWIEGNEWEPNTTVNISIDDPATTENPDFSTAAVTGTVEWASNDRYFLIHLHGSFDIKAGFLVTITDGWATKQHRVTNLVATGLNVEEDIVFGEAAPSSPLQMHTNCPDSPMELVTDANGNWSTNFAGQCDLVPNQSGRTLQVDEDGDSTADDWRVLNPAFDVALSWSNMAGQGWTSNSPVSITVDDPATTLEPDLSTTVTSDPSGNISCQFWQHLTLQPGFTVTVDDGTYVKAHTIFDVAVVDANAATDTVHGYASPGSTVTVATCGDIGCATRDETADGNGHWTANFVEPGEDSDEQAVFNLQPGTEGSVRQTDPDGDTTSVYWRVRKPIIAGVTASNNWISGNEWPSNTSVQVSIDNPFTPQNPDYATNGNTDASGNFSFQSQFDIAVGFVVSVTDGSLTKQVTVSNFEVTSIDWVADTLAGVGTPGASGSIGLPNWWEPFVIDPAGHWQVNLAGKVDLQPDAQGFAAEQDHDGDRTGFSWRVPYLLAQPAERRVTSFGWRLGSLVTLSVDDPDIPDSPDYWAKQPVTLSWDLNQTRVIFDLANGIRLKPGMVITLTDGNMTRTHTIMNLAITGTDLEADTVIGKAAPGTDVNVGHLGCEQTACTWRHVTADGSGNWIADFSVPGAGSDEQGIFDIVPGTGSWASQRDEDGDETSLYWSSPSIQASISRPGHGVEGYGWPLGSSITLTVDNPGNGTGTDYTDIQVAELDEWGGTAVLFELGDFELETGAIVTLTDGTSTRTHTVTYLDVTYIDAETDRVSGKAEPGSPVEVHFRTGELFALRNVMADQAGDWIADFSTAGSGSDEQALFDIHPGIWASITQYGDGKNKTQLHWQVPEYRVVAYSDGDMIIATDFWPGTFVTIGVDDPDNGVGIDLTRSGIVSTEPGGWECQTWWGYCFVLDLWGEFDVQAGQLITIADGTHTRSHVVTPIWITRVDTDRSTVSGVANPLSDVYLDAWPCAARNRHAVADANGHWFEDFSIPGDEDFEQETCDFTTEPFTGTAYERSEDGETWVGWTDADADGISDRIDNAPSIFNPDQRDVDQDSTADVLDPCPDDSTNTCDPDGSAVSVIGAQGGMIVTLNEKASLNIPAGSVHEDISFTITDRGGGYELTSDQGPMLVVHGYSIQPHGTQFQPPATIVFRWEDADSDGILDGTTVPESDLRLIKDGIVITPACSANPDCDISANQLTVQVSDLSLFALAVPAEWMLKGFFPPVDMNGVYNLVKGGNTVPLKFELFAGSTELTDVAAIMSLAYAQTACDAHALTDPIEVTVSGATSLRYDPLAGQFIYNWKTPVRSGICWRVKVTTVDGSSLEAYFKLK